MEGVAQALEHVLWKHEALSSAPAPLNIYIFIWALHIDFSLFSLENSLLLYFTIS
jgi:hypothetical protein